MSESRSYQIPHGGESPPSPQPSTSTRTTHRHADRPHREGQGEDAPSVARLERAAVVARGGKGAREGHPGVRRAIRGVPYPRRRGPVRLWDLLHTKRLGSAYHAGMPVRYERDDARRRVVVTVQGVVAPADFLAIIERRRAEGIGGYGMLYDLRRAAGEATIDDLRQFLTAAAPTSRPQGGRIALVAIDPVLYARACTYAELGRSVTMTIEVFRDMDEANRWLAADTSP